MWAFIVRRLLYNVPVYLGILLMVMIFLRVGGDPVGVYLGKNADEDQIRLMTEDMGLDRPFLASTGSWSGTWSPSTSPPAAGNRSGRWGR